MDGFGTVANQVFFSYRLFQDVFEVGDPIVHMHSQKSEFCVVDIFLFNSKFGTGDYFFLDFIAQILCDLCECRFITWGLFRIL